MNASPETTKRSPHVEARTETCDVSAPPPSPCKRRVLIVDDEERIIAALRRLLRREDYELVTANCGSAAIALLEANPVQLVISDYRMPGMTGVELLHEIRRRWPNILRIILSGYSEVNAIISAINEGEIYKFISKPWNDEELRLHIRRAIEQHDLELQNRKMEMKIRAQNEKLSELNEVLDQRAADAATGLNFSQELLEALDVGVVGVDESGLIVWANRQGHEIISSGTPELIGIPAEVALPRALHELACATGLPDDGAASCRVRINGKEHQCRVKPLVTDGNHRGNVVALWENVE